MLRSAFVSLFWGIIMERKKRGSFTLQSLAKILGTNKGEVSRWFNGDPNWTINTIANLANALDVDIKIQATDRNTGAIFTPAGIQTVVSTNTAMKPPVETMSGGISGAPLIVVQRPGDPLQPKDIEFFVSEAA